MYKMYPVQKPAERHFTLCYRFTATKGAVINNERWSIDHPESYLSDFCLKVVFCEAVAADPKTQERVRRESNGEVEAVMNRVYKSNLRLMEDGSETEAFTNEFNGETIYMAAVHYAADSPTAPMFPLENLWSCTVLSAPAEFELKGISVVYSNGAYSSISVEDSPAIFSMERAIYDDKKFMKEMAEADFVYLNGEYFVLSDEPIADEDFIPLVVNGKSNDPFETVNENKSIGMDLLAAAPTSEFTS